MGIFGWDYPPGCHSVPGDEPDEPCEICGQEIDECICPECPVCESVGDPTCYFEHGMRRNEPQKFLLECAHREWADESYGDEIYGDEYLNEEGSKWT